MKQATGIDNKRRAAGEREEEGSGKSQTVAVGLIDESEVPAVARVGGKRSALLDTQEWRQACEILNKGLPEKKVLRIPLSAETLKLGKTTKGTAIAFKRHLTSPSLVAEQWQLSLPQLQRLVYSGRPLFPLPEELVSEEQRRVKLPGRASPAKPLLGLAGNCSRMASKSLLVAVLVGQS